jgi:hypothetical protein
MKPALIITPKEIFNTLGVFPITPKVLMMMGTKEKVAEKLL